MAIRAVIAAGVAASTACTQGSVTPGPVLACETGTGGSVPTEGGDHGAPWDPQPLSADETMMPYFDTPPETDMGGPPPPLVDPTSWEIDPSGVHYRRATQNELGKNRWHPDVLLVAPSTTVINALKNGASSTTLQIPLVDPPGWPQEDLPMLAVSVLLRGSGNLATFTEKRQNATGTGTTITRSRPTYRYYLQQGLNWDTITDHALQVFSSSRGGVVLDGATIDRSFWLDGPYSSRNGIITIDIQPTGGRSVFLLYTHLESPTSFVSSAGVPEIGIGSPSASGDPVLDLASEFAPQAAGEHQCADGYDNDVLDGADACDYACMAHPDFAGVEFPAPRLWEYRKTFALFGDAVWCTQHELNADIALWAAGAVASQTLNCSRLRPPSWH